jgi:hypothetical protein
MCGVDSIELHIAYCMDAWILDEYQQEAQQQYPVQYGCYSSLLVVYIYIDIVQTEKWKMNVTTRMEWGVCMCDNS